MATYTLRRESLVALALIVLLAIFTTYHLRADFSPDASQKPAFITLPNELAESHPNFYSTAQSSHPSTLSVPSSPPEPSPSSPSPPPPADSPETQPEKEQALPETSTANLDDTPEPTAVEAATATNKEEPLKLGLELEGEDHARPIYKPEPTFTPPPVVDNFPLAAAAHSAAELPPVPPWNKPPYPHVPEKTPLFIGFTRNWRLLQQAVVSYITAGWPPEDIYIIENTGTMKSNELGLLTIQNPFFLNHTRLHMFGVNIIVTPTLLSFSQLQNFYIWTAIQNNFTTYFYGHMDVVVLPYEDQYTPDSSNQTDTDTYSEFKTIYERAVDTLRLATSPEPDPNASNSSKPWAARFFSYDRLALVNRKAYESIGGWDTAIPYYFSDCDMHDRLKMYGFEYNEADVEIGDFFDVAGSLDNLLVLYRKNDSVEASFVVDGPQMGSGNVKQKREPKIPIDRRQANQSWTSDEIGSAPYKQLHEVADAMAKYKNEGGPNGRNTWQARQNGGQGEPYYRDPEGFETGIQMITQTGRDIYAEKWGHKSCNLLPFGRKAGDEWRVEHDWE